MICKLSAWQTARTLDTGVPPPGWVMRHQSRCPRCRAVYETEQRVAAMLCQGTTTAGLDVDPLLHNRIMRAVRTAGQEPRTAPHFLSLVWIPATAVALAVALGIGWLTASAVRRNSLTPTEAHLGEAPHTAPGIHFDLNIPLQDLTETVQRWADSPFQSEAEALQRDLSDASRFLLACAGGTE